MSKPPLPSSDSHHASPPGQPDSSSTPPGPHGHFCYAPEGFKKSEALVHHALGHGPIVNGYMEYHALHIERLLSDQAAHILRLHHSFDKPKDILRDNCTVECVLLKMPDGVFVRISADLSRFRIDAFAKTREQVAHWLKHFSTRYAKRVTHRARPSFVIVMLNNGSPAPEDVSITRSHALDHDTLRLLYGDDFPAWEQNLVAGMKGRDAGVVLFRGSPGTGKTSFIRHLMDRLKRTHRFYYLPVTQQELLTSPQMLPFWACEGRRYGDKKKVIVLEDAELLLERGQYGRSGAVANLLNIADGLLGEFLKVQLLCTINCDITRLDEAVTRPGRLLDYRDFPRLAPDHARRIAAKHGLQLPDLPDYALSDIFGKKPDAFPSLEAHRRIMGFAVV